MEGSLTAPCISRNGAVLMIYSYDEGRITNNAIEIPRDDRKPNGQQTVTSSCFNVQTGEGVLLEFLPVSFV